MYNVSPLSVEEPERENKCLCVCLCMSESRWRTRCVQGSCSGTMTEWGRPPRIRDTLITSDALLHAHSNLLCPRISRLGSPWSRWLWNTVLLSQRNTKVKARSFYVEVQRTSWGARCARDSTEWPPFWLSCFSEVTRATGTVDSQKHLDCLEVGIWSTHRACGCSCIGDQNRWIKALITDIAELRLHLLRSCFASHCILQETWRFDLEFRIKAKML